MPELPEVEAVRSSIETHCLGLVIESVIAPLDEKVIVDVTSEDLISALRGRRIVNVRRKGKNFWLELDERPWPVIHLGMAGAVIVQGKKSVQYKRSLLSQEDDVWPPKYHKLVVELEGGVKFAFVDSRRFGRIRLQNDPLIENPISLLGPDAFLDLPEPSHFTETIQKRSKSIKAVLLDQSVFSGIGNWIADEVLYQAHIHPEHSCKRLSEEQCITLHSKIVQVLEIAVEVGADKDCFPADWIFHKRWMKKPGKMNGKEIKFITVGGRTSAFVPHVQKLSSADKAGVSKTVAKGHDSDSEDGIPAEIAAPKAKKKGVSRKKTSEPEMELDVEKAVKVEGNGGEGSDSGLRRSSRLKKSVDVSAVPGGKFESLVESKPRKRKQSG